MDRINATADVYKAFADASDWVVWCLDPNEDGGILEAIFSGPNAESRALEYAAEKYVEFRRHEPHRRPHLCHRNPNADASRSPSPGATLRLVERRP